MCGLQELDQIYEKTNTRIQNLQDATTTRGIGNMPTPSLEEIQRIRRLQFRIDSDSIEVKKAVEAQLNLLRLKHPTWNFSTVFGQQ